MRCLTTGYLFLRHIVVKCDITCTCTCTDRKHVHVLFLKQLYFPPEEPSEAASMNFRNLKIKFVKKERLSVRRDRNTNCDVLLKIRVKNTKNRRPNWTIRRNKFSLISRTFHFEVCFASVRCSWRALRSHQADNRPSKCEFRKETRMC